MLKDLKNDVGAKSVVTYCKGRNRIKVYEFDNRLEVLCSPVGKKPVVKITTKEKFEKELIGIKKGGFKAMTSMSFGD